MPLTSYINGRSFDLETLKCMGTAFEAAVSSLGLLIEASPSRKLLRRQWSPPFSRATTIPLS
jgi:hypothetical protein